MKVSELMQGKTPNTSFAGFATNDDWVLALDINDTGKENEFEVVQMGIAGLDPQMNPVTQDKQYIRTGMSTSKTGTQRSFAVTGDRYIGDAFQDFCFNIKNAFGVGATVVKDYVYFSILTGKGEKGKASIIVNSDGGGNAGENSGISVDIKSTGVMPTEYTYSAGTM